MKFHCTSIPFLSGIGHRIVGSGSQLGSNRQLSIGNANVDGGGKAMSNVEGIYLNLGGKWIIWHSLLWWRMQLQHIFS